MEKIRKKEIRKRVERKEESVDKVEEGRVRQKT